MFVPVWQQSAGTEHDAPGAAHVGAQFDDAAQTPSDCPSTGAQHPLWHSASVLHAAWQRLSLLMQIAPDGPMPEPVWQQFVVAVQLVPTESQLLLLLLLLPLSLLLLVPPSFWAWLGSMHRPSEHTREPLQSLSDAHRSATDVAQATAPNPTNTTATHVFRITSLLLQAQDGRRKAMSQKIFSPTSSGDRRKSRCGSRSSGGCSRIRPV
jgi:hypothetical protein